MVQMLLEQQHLLDVYTETGIGSSKAGATHLKAGKTCWLFQLRLFFHLNSIRIAETSPFVGKSTISHCHLCAYGRCASNKLIFFFLRKWMDCWHGATNHMTSRANLLVKIRPNNINFSHVCMPNGVTSVVTHICSCNNHIFTSVGNNHILHDVLIVSDFQYNLISVSKLTTIWSCYVVFSHNLVVFHDHSGGMVIKLMVYISYKILTVLKYLQYILLFLQLELLLGRKISYFGIEGSSTL